MNWMNFFALHIADFKDLGKVNGISFGTVGLSETLKANDIVAMNEIIQSTGNSIIILLAVGYTAFKLLRMFREMQWEKEDRENELNED